MSVEPFNTARLSVRRWDEMRLQSRDSEQLKKILSPSVLAHLPPPLQNVADVDTWIADRNAESEVYGISENASPIGLLILAEIEKFRVHIGYLLAENAWGKGFASELIQGLVTAIPQNTTLIGGVGVDNPASARVLEKAGFSQDTENSTQDHTIYALTIS